MSRCSIAKTHGLKLNDLQTQIDEAVAAVTANKASAAPLADLQSLQSAVTANKASAAPLAGLQSLTTTVTNLGTDVKGLKNASAGAATLSALLADPSGLVCRAATGTGDFGELFPGGRAFTLCQPSASWGATDLAFAELLPEGGKWTAATAHPVCTPLPARPGLFGASVLCAATLPDALALAADLRTIKDRCVGDDSAAPDVLPSCTVKAQIPGWCDTVSQADCNTTAASNGMMCTWDGGICKASRAATGTAVWMSECINAL